MEIELSSMRPKVMSIIAGGHSFAGIDPKRVPGTTIGVNEAGVLADADVIVSMDRLWAEHRWLTLKQRAKPTWLRRSAVQNIKYITETTLDGVTLKIKPYWLKIFECDHTSRRFTDERGELNGTNSGMCAFNLAYKFRPETLYLFGFDMNRSPDGRPYWYPPYAWTPPAGATSDKKYRDWSKEFDIAAQMCQEVNIKVINASLSSSIPNFPKVDPRSVLVEAA